MLKLLYQSSGFFYQSLLKFTESSATIHNAHLNSSIKTLSSSRPQSIELFIYYQLYFFYIYLNLLIFVRKRFVQIQLPLKVRKLVFAVVNVRYASERLLRFQNWPITHVDHGNYDSKRSRPFVERPA